MGLCQIVNSGITEQLLTKNIRVYELISAIKRLKLFVKKEIQTFSKICNLEITNLFLEDNFNLI